GARCVPRSHSCECLFARRRKIRHCLSHEGNIFGNNNVIGRRVSPLHVMRITAILLAALTAALVFSGQVVPRPRNSPVAAPPTTDAPPSTKPGTVDGAV